MRVDREPAFVLHTRAYRETSQLVDLLTPNHGRVRLVARGTRKQGKLQPFTQQEVSWSGKTELKTLQRTEPVGHTLLLKGVSLYAGLYLNELLIRLVQESDTHLALFTAYRTTLVSLLDPQQVEVALRQFELLLLRELGYGLEPGIDVLSGEPVRDGAWYWFEPGSGLQVRHRNAGDNRYNWFAGASLKAIGNHDFAELNVRRDAKRLLRLALQPLLGDKPLQSRELFYAARPPS